MAFNVLINFFFFFLGDENNEDEPSLLHTYCELMSEVNRLRREERELGLQAQELEMEDNLTRCEAITTNGNILNIKYWSHLMLVL